MNLSFFFLKNQKDRKKSTENTMLYTHKVEAVFWYCAKPLKGVKQLSTMTIREEGIKKGGR